MTNTCLIISIIKRVEEEEVGRGMLTTYWISDLLIHFTGINSVEAAERTISIFKILIYSSVYIDKI